MFRVLNLRKLRCPALLLLLFCVLTAIIARRAPKGEPALPASAAAADAGPTLVIDAGHGGLDGGASAADGETESVINLAIARRLALLARLFGVKSVMTRTGETLDYPPEAATTREKKAWDQKSRAEKINSTENAVLISIHQNKYPDPRPSGSQVLYAKTEGSDVLGELTHENLIAYLCPGNRRVAAPISDTIYLMKQIECPGILVECGFLSNPEEAAKLETEAYQTALAAVLLGSYLSYIQNLS